MGTSNLIMDTINLYIEKINFIVTKNEKSKNKEINIFVIIRLIVAQK